MKMKNLFNSFLFLITSVFFTEIWSAPSMDVYQNDTFDIINPCPLGGIKIDSIFGNIQSKSRYFAIYTSDSCISSEVNFHYSEHLIRLDKNKTYLWEISDTNMIINVYAASKYFVEDACSGKLPIIKDGNQFALTSENYSTYVVFVVGGLDGQPYGIFSNEVVYEYAPECIFDCIEKKNVLENTISVPPIIDVSFPITNVIVDTLIGGDCLEMDRIERKQILSSLEEGTTQIVCAEYLFRNPLDIDIHFPKDLTLACGDLDLPPNVLFEDLRQQLGDSAAYSSIYPNIDGKPILDFNLCQVQIYYEDELTYGCEINVSTIGVQRLWTVVNSCTNDTFQHVQHISRKYEKPILTKIEDQTIYVSSFDCSGKLSVPIIHEHIDCPLNYDLKLLPSNNSCISNGDVFICDFSIGEHSIEYFIQDCYGFSTDTMSFYLKVLYDEVPVINSFLGTVELNADTITIDKFSFENIISNNVFEKCLSTKIEFSDLNLTCDTLADQKISLCCGDLITEEGLLLLEREVDVADIKVWTDNNMDGLFELPGDVFYTNTTTLKVKDKIKDQICPRDTILPCLNADINPALISVGLLAGQCYDHPMFYISDINRDTINNNVEIIRYIQEKAIAPAFRCIQKIILENCTSSLDGIDDSNFFKVQIEPNPFVISSDINITTSANKKVIVEVFNIMGQKVFQKEFISSEGVNTIVLSKDDLLFSGTYFSKLTVGQKSVVKKVVLIGQ